MTELVTVIEAAPYLTGAALAARFSVPVARYYMAPKDVRPNILAARRARRSWKRFCAMTGLTVQRQPGFLDNLAAGKDKKAEPQTLWPALRTRPDRFGFSTLSKAMPGIGIEDWDKRRAYIADQWGAQRLKIWQPEPGLIATRAFLREPLEAVVPSELTTIDGTPLVKPGTIRADFDILIGYTEDGEEVIVNLAKGTHGAIQGVTRSGKSITVNTILAHAALMPDVQSVIIDPNLGAVAPWWRTAHTVSADVDPTGPTEILRAVRAELERRQGVFWAQRTDKITKFTPDMPLILLVIDEVSNYTNWGDKKKADAFRAELQALVSQGHKFGLRVWLLGQKLEAAVLNTATRTNITTRISHRVDTVDDFLHLFPDGRDLEVTAASRTIPQGVGIASVPGLVEPSRMRSVLLPTEHCWTISDAIVETWGEVRPLPRPKLELAKEAAERAA